MKIVIFGLTITSSWGNGHATIWRGLCKALYRRGHNIVFFEKDVHYYSENRDLFNLNGTNIILYSDWNSIRKKAEQELLDSDVGIVTSYCPDATTASDVILASHVIKIFYDLDTPVTLKILSEGKNVDYIPKNGLGNFDLVLSYTGGKSLNMLTELLQAKKALPLYGCVDPETHFPVDPVEKFKCDYSYLGTYAADRQEKLEKYFVATAEKNPEKKFIVGGSMYPENFPWKNNIIYLAHVQPADHPAFYCSSGFTLNITRGAMAEMGYCPSGRLFEAAACEAPILSDYWEGIENFYLPNEEIIIVNSTEETLNALDLSENKKKRISKSARERTLEEHTAEKRILEFEKIIESCYTNNLK